MWGITDSNGEKEGTVCRATGRMQPNRPRYLESGAHPPPLSPQAQRRCGNHPLKGFQALSATRVAMEIWSFSVIMTAFTY